MDSLKSSSQATLFPDPYERALEQALVELEALNGEAKVCREKLAGVEARIGAKVALVESLLGELPPSIRTVYRQRREIKSRSLRPSYGTEVYENVVRLFGSREQREWTAPQVQEALQNSGVKADPQQVYNVLSYLARKGLLRRVGRGRYFIIPAGCVVETGSDDLELPIREAET